MVAVIINHFNKDLLPSGYLGVDIFFVISGYVITSSLAGRESKNFLDFLSGFYERRIKRLVPALVVFVLITSVLISLFNPEPGVALGLGWRSLFGISNISLYRGSTDYFAESTELNPFTHTWSLGVEEQFYLLFPFLIWFSGFGQQTAKGARNLFFWVGAMTIASLLGFIYLYQVNQPAAYFLMPPRFWEMAAGCLLFIGFQKRAKIEQALEQVPPLLVVAAMVGVMYLPVAAAVPATIGIVVLSAVLIACLKRETVAYKFFTLEKVVYIGLISYSLYLWHWTVLSISRWTIGIHWWSAPVQAGLMLLLAIASYRWVERPARQKSGNLSRWKTMLIGTGFASASFGAIFSIIKPLTGTLYQGDKVITQGEYRSMNAGATNYGLTKEKCFEALFSSTDPNKCRANKGSSERTLYFVGDSHSLSIWKTAEKVAQEARSSLFVYGYSSTPFPVLDYTRLSTKYDGREQFKSLHKFLRSDDGIREGDIVFVTLILPGYFSSKSQITIEKARKVLTPQDFLEMWVQEVIDLSSFLKSRNASLVLFAPSPIFKNRFEQCTKQWFNVFSRAKCEHPKSAFMAEYANIFEALGRIENTSNNVYVFNLLEAVCPGKICSYDRYGFPLYRDEHHINDYAAREVVAPRLLEFLSSKGLVQN
ncbi:acyltransferase family protein [Vulcanococcus limneticus]|uniref:acyltransferase family protein n=1 Tax=Vulcanococcus limneticus TaxID=2170428 RepID=UPI0036F3B1B3